MRCLIVDDEAPARLELRQLLSAVNGVEIVGEAANVECALVLTAWHRPEVVFLDVKLRGETGFDYVSRATEPTPHLVFVTAYDDYAVRGFECNALDYLLKPVSPDRLAETFRRVRERQAPPRRQAMQDDFVYLKVKESISRFVPWQSVTHILSEGNYSRVFLADGSNALVLRPLKEWPAIAPSGFLLQVHRTTLISHDTIREVRVLPNGRRELTLRNGTDLPVGRSYWPHLRTVIDNTAI